MTQKIIAITDSLDILRNILIKYPLVDAEVHEIAPGDNRRLVAIRSNAFAHRFDIANESGVVVLPGMHDPSPIGDLSAKLGHINAQPNETMREISLRLYAKHGPAFHADS